MYCHQKIPLEHFTNLIKTSVHIHYVIPSESSNETLTRLQVHALYVIPSEMLHWNTLQT